MSSLLITFLIISFVGLWFKYRQRKIYILSITDNFPTPPRRPILGHTMLFENHNIDPYEMFHRGMAIPKDYGPIVALFRLFNKAEFMVSGPEDIETIMTGKTSMKGDMYEFMKPWLGEGLLISFGTKWFNRRKVITPTFHFKILEQFLDIFNEQDKKLVQKLQKYVETKEDCNIYEHLTLVALDNICETAMGVKINAQDNPKSDYIDAIKEMGEIVFNRFFSPIGQFTALFPLTPDGFRCRRVVKTLHKFTDNVIENRKKQLNGKNVEINHNDIKDENEGRKQRFSFLDMLLQSKIYGEPLSQLDIREEVDTFMFEGHDTTTAGMTFAIYNLAMYPEVQEKVFEEARVIMGDDPNTCFSYNDIQEMKYLEKVIKEVLRIHPPVPFIGRKTSEIITLGGVTIPAGFNIQIPIYAIHRNEKIFPNPDMFDPERFDEEKERSWKNFDYIPFSAGSRNCIGQRFAMLEMKAILSSIIRNYKIVATDKTKEMRYQCDMILRAVDGVYVRLEKRKY